MLLVDKLLRLGCIRAQIKHDNFLFVHVHHYTINEIFLARKIQDGDCVKKDILCISARDL